MADNALRYSIDASQAERGAQQFVKAVKSIRSASKSNVKATAEDFERLKTVMASADFSKLARSLKTLNSIEFKATGLNRFVKSMQGLSAFKGPSRAAVTRVSDMAKAIRELDRTSGSKGAKNLIQLAQAAKSLDGIGNAAGHLKTLRSAVVGMANVKASGIRQIVILFNQLGKIKVTADLGRLAALAQILQTIRPPSAARVGSMKLLFDTLATARIPNGVGTGLMRIGTAFAAFKPPTKAQTQRFIDFIHAMNGMKFSGDVARMVSALDRVTASASRAGTAFGRFRKNITSLPTASATRGINRMSGSLRGLENAFSLSFHAGSIFRTLIGGLSLGVFARDVFRTSINFLKADSAFRVATGSAEGAVAEMSKAVAMIQRTGGAIETVLPRYAKFVAAASQSGLTMDESRFIFEQVGGALAVLGGNAEDAELAFLAIEQIASKGVLSSEELRRQLAERLPGAFQLMAKALYPAIVASEGLEAAQVKLNKDLKSGSISSVKALKLFSVELQKVYGPELENALKRPDIALNRLNNSYTFFKKAVADNGFMYELGIAFDKLATAMDGPEFAALAVQLSEGLARAVRMAADAMVWMIYNAQQVKDVLKLVIIGVLAFKAVNIAGNVSNAALSMTYFAKSLLSTAAGFDLATAAAKIFRVALIATGIGAIIIALTSLAAYLYLSRNRLIEMGGSTAKLGTIFGVLVDRFKSGLSVIASAFVKLAGLLAYMPSPLRYLLSVGGDVMDKLGIKFTSAGDFLWTAFKTPINLVLNGFAAIGRMIGVVMDFAIERFNGLGVAMEQVKSGNLLGAAATLSGVSAGANFVDGMKGALSENKDFVGDWIEGVVAEAATRDSTAAFNKLFSDGMSALTAPKKDGLTLTMEEDKKAKATAASIKKESGERDKLLKKYLLEKYALEEFIEAKNRANAMLKDGSLKIEEHAILMVRLNRETLEARAPVEALNRDVSERIDLLQRTINVGDAEADYIKTITDLRLRKVIGDKEEIEGLKEKLRLEQSLLSFNAIRDRLDPQRRQKIDNGKAVASINDSGLSAAAKGDLLARQAFSSRNDGQALDAVDGLRGIAEELNPISAATVELSDKIAILNEAQRQGIVIAGGYAAAEKKLREQYKDQLSPLDALNRSIRERVLVLRMTDRQQRIYAASLEMINDLKAKGITITGKLAREVTQLAAQMDSLDNPRGFAAWIKSVGTLQDKMSDLAATVGDELSASFAKLFTTGSFPIKDFLTAIRDEAASAAGDLATKEIFNTVGLGDKGGLIGGAKGALKAMTDGSPGGIMAGFSQGYNERKTPTGLSKGDTAIVDVLNEILVELGGGATSADPFASKASSGVLGGLGKIAGSFFDGKKGNSLSSGIGSLLSGGKDIAGSFFDGQKGNSLMSGIGSLFGGGNAANGGAGSAIGDMLGMGQPGASGASGGGIGSTVGSVGGAAVGSFFGLPPQIGSAIGGMLGGLFDKGKDDKKGGKGTAIPSTGDPTLDTLIQIREILSAQYQATQAATQQSGGGAGGIMSMLGSAGGASGGAGGTGGGIASLFAGFFSEGGYSGSAVKHGLVPASSFHNAPQYAEGTANVSSGGRPAILHPNEAVIPLSRGRAVPVDMRGNGGGGKSSTANVTFNISTPDANSFGRSEAQLAARYRRSIQRAQRDD